MDPRISDSSISSVDGLDPRFPTTQELHSPRSLPKVGGSIFRYESNASVAILLSTASLMAKTRSFAHPYKHGVSWEEALLPTGLTAHDGAILQQGR